MYESALLLAVGAELIATLRAQSVFDWSSSSRASPSTHSAIYLYPVLSSRSPVAAPPFIYYTTMNYNAITFMFSSDPASGYLPDQAILLMRVPRLLIHGLSIPLSLPLLSHPRTPLTGTADWTNRRATQRGEKQVVPA
jgi:hypothetical protein